MRTYCRLGNSQNIKQAFTTQLVIELYEYIPVGWSYASMLRFLNIDLIESNLTYKWSTENYILLCNKNHIYNNFLFDILCYNLVIKK